MTNISNNKSQKEAFLFYLKKMDMIMLDIVLPDSITYFGANKTDFLDRIAYMVNQFKLAGEKTPLNINQKEEFTNSYYLTSNILDFEFQLDLQLMVNYLNNI